MHINRIFAIAAFLVGATFSAHANVLYDNNSNGLGSGASVAYQPIGDGLLGQSFTSGPGAAILYDVTLNFVLSDNPAGGAFVVQLFTDAGGTTPTPGAAIMTLGIINDNDLTGPIDFSGLGLLLNPATRYWVVASDAYTGSDPALASLAQWQQALDSSGSGVVGEWAYADGQSLPVDASLGQTAPFVMTVAIGVDIPEPTSLALLGVGMAALGARRAGNRKTK
jgi:hypothetical protein